MTVCEKFEEVDFHREGPDDCWFCKHWLCKDDKLWAGVTRHTWQCEYPDKQQEVVEPSLRKIERLKAATYSAQTKLISQ